MLLPLCQQAFRDWLKRSIRTLDDLNHAWWTDFWSHTYTSWDQIHAPQPNGEMNVHGLTLDWKRFVTYQTVDFMKMERDTVKEVNPDIPVTANLMGFYDGSITLSSARSSMLFPGTTTRSGIRPTT
mgnify:CR=1 FL=1